MLANSNVTAITNFVHTNDETYAFRRFGNGAGLPLLCLSHFMGTMDNWDPAVTDPLASGREVILFDNAGVGKSTGQVPSTIAAMAHHAFTFLDALGISECDVLGFSLGGMIAQQLAIDRPSMFRRLILVGTAPRGGGDIMHVEKPEIVQFFNDPQLNEGYRRLQKLFFAPSASSQAEGEAFIQRLERRVDDLEPRPNQDVAAAQIAAFREWEQFSGERFADLHRIHQPVMVVNGIHDILIPIENSYALGENLPNAVLLTYPDAGHGSLFQFHESFTRQAAAFLDSNSQWAPF
jgi:pimeloyl-ACP methyl ester carboxylesterase